jgi:hypothetical protein
LLRRRCVTSSSGGAANGQRNYREIDHHTCLAGDWEKARAQLIESGRTAIGASQGVREVRDFYELGEDTLWVTIADGHLHWAFAEGEVLPLDQDDPGRPSRIRRTRKGWRERLCDQSGPFQRFNSGLNRTLG